MNIPGLYIHIPFCLKKCDYCDFYSVTSISRIPDFLKALFQRNGDVRGQLGPFDTVYLGGGTPSVLGISQLRDVLKEGSKRILPCYPTQKSRVEANPGDLDPVFLKRLREME